MTDVDPHLPASITRDIADLERRLRIMERSNRLTTASVTDGSLDVMDADRARRVAMGKLDDGRFGLAAYDANGNERFRADDRGIIAPSGIFQVASVNDGVVAGASSALSHKMYGGLLAHSALQINVPWDSSGGTSSVNVFVTDAGGLVSTGTGVGPLGAGGVIVFRWLHTLALGSTGEFRLFIQKASGAGTPTVRPPIVWGVDPALATATGL